MANLAALDVANMMKWGSVQVYTVGAPRVGNHAYAGMYNKLVPDTWGIINYRVHQHCLLLLLPASAPARIWQDGDCCP